MHLSAEDEERLAIHKKAIVAVLLIETWNLLCLAESRRNRTGGEEQDSNGQNEPKRRVRMDSTAN
jgi:hypothetical protein